MAKSYSWPLSNYNDIRHRRNCAFKMHVHVVCVAKYRRRVFDGDAIKRLCINFNKVCVAFEASLIDMDGEDDHVRRLVEYPTKVAVSNLVNNQAACYARKGPIFRSATGRACSGRLPTSHRPEAAHRLPSCASTSSNSRRHIEKPTARTA